MFRISLHRSLLALSLVLTLSSTASAAPVSWGGPLLEESRGILLQLLRVLPGAIHPKAGCSINPNGQPICLPKHGCGIDPQGQPLCPPVVTPKAGCGINPDGKPQCSAVVTPKHGCSINPNGAMVCTP
jgi:hypothetical protein